MSISNLNVLQERFNAIKEAYNYYTNIEFGEINEAPETLGDYAGIGVAYTTLGDNEEYAVEAVINLTTMELYSIVNTEVIHIEPVTIEKLNKMLYSYEFFDFLAHCEEYVEHAKTYN